MKAVAIFTMLLGLFCVLNAASQITIDASQPKSDISPTMYGLFFEDINFGADGGLYAELVKNRSFQFDRPMMGWEVLKKSGAQGDVLVLRDDTQKNPRLIRIRIDNAGSGFGLKNEGFRGMGIRENAAYRLTLWAKKLEGEVTGVTVQIVTPHGNVLAESRVNGFTQDWASYTCELTANATQAKAEMILWFEGQGTLDIDFISLFPKDTWKGRENGLRADLVQLLADIKPGFLRFPGGCIVEGFDLSQRYQWKHTIGDPRDRIVNINRWNFEFNHRPAPDYFQSYGLGYFEYFLLAEDIGAEPMPIINCGMACQFNTCELVPMDQLGPYVQDALDLIEFANGPVDSEWGKIRADMGHSKPFNMKMIGIGNEQWGEQYIERYKVFAAAIKEKYPEMQLIAAAGSDATIFPNGRAEIDYLWSQWRILKPEFVDEHFYRQPDWFVQNTDWYDDYDRTGPKLFVGEWAAQSEGVANPDNRNTWKTALYEAAFMIGLEHNADLVRMSCYAPLFGHEDAWQWRPDLIWFDNLKSYGSANYYVQKLFSLNAGTQLLDVHGDKDAEGIFVSSTVDENTNEAIIKVVNINEEPAEINIELHGKKIGKGMAKGLVLTSDSLDDMNSIEYPQKIYPHQFTIKTKDDGLTHQFAPFSVTVVRVPIKR